MNFLGLLALIVGGVYIIYILLAMFFEDGFISKENAKAFMYLGREEYSLSDYDDTMIYVWRERSYICPPLMPNPFAKYEVEGYGLVLRWGKLHRQIEWYYERAKTDYAKKVAFCKQKTIK